VKQQVLQGQTALITGAAMRIGREIAVALAQEGVNIVIHYRSSAKEAEELCTQLAEHGAKSWTVRADFEHAEETETLIDRAWKLAGSLDILINSASTFPKSTLNDVRFEDLVLNMRVNAWAPFVLSREFARRADRGKIVNLLDTQLSGYDFSHVAYFWSKHLFSVLTAMTALQFAPSITVNGISPGLILPPPGANENHVDLLAEKVPLKRQGSPRDVTGAVIYLLKSNYVTGHVVQVDGGQHLVE